MTVLLATWRLLINNYRRPFFGLCGFLLLVLAIDFMLRIFVPRDASMRNFTAPAASPIASPETSESAFKRLAAWIPTQAVATAPQEREIKLQGVFGAGSDGRAALLLLPPGGGPGERVRAVSGQVVEGWTVERIERGRVLLKRGEESRELVLFRPRPE